MNIQLAQNIRKHRKKYSLTQEQLAQTLGVTAGAVYKWEAKLCVPDIDLIMEMADLFHISVDVLLGYEIKDNRPATIVKRLSELKHAKDKQGLQEADKALIRYPNCFEIVHQSAKLYYLFGLMSHDSHLLKHSIELMERAILLIGQNTDPEISELSIYSDMASAYSLLGEEEKSVDLLKNHNACGIFDDVIGYSLGAACNRPEESMPYLSKALVNTTTVFTRIVLGYYNVYYKTGKFSEAADILQIAADFFRRLKIQDKNTGLDKISAAIFACLAVIQTKLNKNEEAVESLCTAKAIAAEFDKKPDYGVQSLRFVSTQERLTAFDDWGETAMDIVVRIIQEENNEMLTALWENIRDDR